MKKSIKKLLIIFFVFLLIICFFSCKKRSNFENKTLIKGYEEASVSVMTDTNQNSVQINFQAQQNQRYLVYSANIRGKVSSIEHFEKEIIKAVEEEHGYIYSIEKTTIMKSILLLRYLLKNSNQI